MSATHYINARIVDGMSSTERLASFDIGDVRRSLFVDVGDVIGDDGIRVTVLERGVEASFVALPGDPITCGSRVMLPNDMIHDVPDMGRMK